MTARSLADHRVLVAELLKPVAPLEVSLSDAVGGMLVEDLKADAPVPALPLARWDGYAVRAADVAGASPTFSVTLPVSHDARFDARVPRRHVPNTAARVTSGTPLPQGADAVVSSSDTDGGLAKVAVRATVEVGNGVRGVGSEARSGEAIVPAGTRLAPRHVAVAAALGRNRVKVRPVPRVVIISVGSELAEPGSHTEAGGVPDVNSLLLSACVREAGAHAYRAGIVPDQPAQLRATIEDHVVRADVIVISGGLSDAAADNVADVVRQCGEFQVDSVALLPGSRHGLGHVALDDDPRAIPVIALPGSPVAAAVAFEAYVRPGLRAMSGLADPGRPELSAIVETGWDSPADYVQLVPVTFERTAGATLRVRPTGEPGTVTLAALAASDGYVLVVESTTHVASGSSVVCHAWEG